MNQYIKLLKKQLEKLEDKNFDLEAWKSGTIAVLSRVFGQEDVRVSQIEKLKIDYSSWALRDSNANYKPIESAKRMGKEILQTAVDEIDLFGLPEPGNKSSAMHGEELSRLHSMSEKERKKHFESMKKEKLVELLMRATG